MNAETLRNSILQRAIEGKLVPQLDKEPEVEQIGNAPEEVPFEIPAKWKWIKMEELTPFGKCERIDSCNFSNGTWLLNLEDIEKDNGKLLSKNKIFQNKGNKHVFKKGDVLYSKLRPYLNKVLVANEDGICTTEIIPLKINENILSNWYFCFFLRSPYFVHYAVSHSYGVKMPRVSTTDAKNALVPIPPVEEQKRIVKKLEEILPLIEEYGRHQELLEKINKDFPVQMEKSLLQEAISGKLVEQLDEEPEVEQVGEAPDETPFEIPEKWKWVLLGDIGVWKSGSTPSRSNPDYYRNGTVNWLKTGDLNDGVITKTEEKVTDVAVTESRLKINPPGSILIAMYGATIGKVGILDIPSATNQACCACVPEDFVDNKYLYYFLLSQRKRFISMGAGGAQPNISKNKIVNFPFPLPPIGEQQRIVAKLDKLMLEIQKLK